MTFETIQFYENDCLMIGSIANLKEIIYDVRLFLQSL